MQRENKTRVKLATSLAVTRGKYTYKVTIGRGFKEGFDELIVVQFFHLTACFSQKGIIK